MAAVSDQTSRKESRASLILLTSAETTKKWSLVRVNARERKDGTHMRYPIQINR